MNADDMQAIAQALDDTLNPDKNNRTTGFVVLTFGFGAPGISNYVSNGSRDDMIIALREAADRLEKLQDNVRYE